MNTVLSKLKYSRKYIVAVLLIAIIISCCTYVIYRYDYTKCLEREAVSLSGYYKDVCNNLISKLDFYNELVRVTNEKYFIRLRVAMASLLTISEESYELARENSSFNNIDYYQLDSNLNIEFQYSKTPLSSLSDEDLKILIQNEKFASSERCYISKKVGDQYGILAVDKSDDDKNIKNYFEYDLSKLASYIIWDNNTGLAIDYNADITEDKIPSLSDFIITETINVNNIKVQHIEYCGKQYLSICNSMLLDDNNLTVCVYKDDGGYALKALFNAGCFALLCILFVISCIFLFFSLQKNRIKFDGSTLYQTKQSNSDRHTYVHLITSSTTLLVLSFTIISAILFSVQNILQIDGEIINAFNNLTLQNKSCSENREIIYTKIEEAGSQYLDDIVVALNYKYDVDMDEWLREITTTIDGDRINIYDKNGVIVNSSSPYKGYSLSRNETDPEYKLWQLLDGSAEQIMFYSEEEQVSYLAARRTDEVGIVEIVTSSEAVSALLEKVEFAELFKIQDFPDADHYYYKRSEPETLYVLESGKAIVRTITNNLPESEVDKTVTGIWKINGQYYLYVDSGNNEWVTIFAYPVTELMKSSLLYLALFTLSYGLTAGIIFNVFRKKNYSIASFIKIPTDAVSEYNIAFKSAFNSIISLLVIFIIIILLIKNHVFYDSMILFEFYKSWETGFNLITLLFIILSLSICIGLIFIIGSFNSLICKVLSSKGATISTLLSNILKVVIFVSFLIGALEQLGVNAAAITASLGMTGLALSIGSKDVVSDLVAGLFIAFEGQLQLGDFVTINNFTGKIESLGIRTTKIQSYNKEMIINNTNMKNVINLSRGMTAFIISVNLPISTDIEHLCKLIDDSSERFNEVCDGNLSRNLSLSGIEKINDTSITCVFWGTTIIEKSSACQMACTTELLKVLRENGFIVENDLKAAIKNVVCNIEK